MATWLFPPATQAKQPIGQTYALPPCIGEVKQAAAKVRRHGVTSRAGDDIGATGRIIVDESTAAIEEEAVKVAATAVVAVTRLCWMRIKDGFAMLVNPVPVLTLPAPSWFLAKPNTIAGCCASVFVLPLVTASVPRPGASWALNTASSNGNDAASPVTGMMDRAA